MRRNDLFILRKIDNDIFLIPTGQAAADMRKALMINERGEFIWETLANDMKLEHLIRLVLEHYMPERDRAEAVSQDVYAFASKLMALGMIVSDDIPVGKDAFINTDIEIAGVKLRIKTEEDILFDRLVPFKSEFSTPDIIVRFRIGLPSYTENGNVFLRNKDVTVLDAGKEFIVIHSGTERIKEIHIDKAAKEANIFSMPPYDDILKEEFMLALKAPFLINALNNGMFMIPSSAVMDGEKLVLFSAPPGTGKSTQAEIWSRSFNAPKINDSFNLVKVNDGEVVSLATPWSDLEESASDIHPVKSIMCLKRNTFDKVEPMDKPTGVLSLLSLSATPLWTDDMTSKALKICDDIFETVDVKRFYCTPTPDSAQCAKLSID